MITTKHEKDVHTEHCCQIHGCKYGERLFCSVSALGVPQSYPCEWCAVDFCDEDERDHAYELNEMFNRGVKFGRENK